MLTQKILESDWSEYDDLKNKGGSDRNLFSCTEPWETAYLVKKITEFYSHVSEDEIKAAISVCCREVGAPHPRKTFVECVMKRLGLK